MEHASAGPEESEAAVKTVEEQRAREREALRRRVRESLVRCPDGQSSPPA
jgi:hypothetical protein